MDYATAKKAVFATVEVPDGYAGKVAKVGIAWVGGVLYEVADCGCYKAPPRKQYAHTRCPACGYYGFNGIECFDCGYRSPGN